jgi:hypothetical protein
MLPPHWCADAGDHSPLLHFNERVKPPVSEPDGNVHCNHDEIDDVEYHYYIGVIDHFVQNAENIPRQHNYQEWQAFPLCAAASQRFDDVCRPRCAKAYQHAGFQNTHLLPPGIVRIVIAAARSCANKAIGTVSLLF